MSKDHTQNLDEKVGSYPTSGSCPTYIRDGDILLFHHHKFMNMMIKEKLEKITKPIEA